MKNRQFRTLFAVLIFIIRELGSVLSNINRQTEYIIDIHQDVWNMYNAIK